MPSTPLYCAAFTLLIRLSTPKLLKPKRLIIPCASFTLNKRGLALPGCARGVTVPTSIKPKPSLLMPSITAPFLSKPAAKPTALGKVMPMSWRGVQIGGLGYKLKIPDFSAHFKLLSVMSCAISASN